MTTYQLADGTVVEIEHSEREPGTPAGGQTVGQLHLWVRYNGGEWQRPDGFTQLLSLMRAVQACANVYVLERDVLCPGDLKATKFWRRTLADGCVVEAAACCRKQYPDIRWPVVRVDGEAWQDVRYRNEDMSRLMNDLEECEGREWVEVLVIGKGA